ncbi:hypothetical protein YUYDRAFT_02080 [Streptomyces sp. ScaeMP-e48]|uniref:hypothetical protein n=1 Tax=Streptomyces sp. ScaeMP-e48 TaxID=1100823 RepID=UPI000823B9FC|nr:hypothetical protein [Streptomyces sp. ScaeMP-e48]SCK20083.1 hypothetical protein YUYDRAFT_02080 [Streptomyces sp. ScaeMP-e48]
MSKQSGLGDHLYISGFDASGDIGAVNRVGGGPALLDVTAINKYAMERIGAVRDGGIDYTAFFNPGVDGAHTRLAALPTTDVVMTYVRGATLGGPVACCIAKQLNHDGTRGDDGAFTFAGGTQGNGYGLEWCTGLTAGKRTDLTATNGTGVDLGVGSTTFGLQAYLHVFAVTGTSVTVKLQQSSDNGAGDAWTDVVGGAFTAATGVSAQRIATAPGQTVERYLRAVTTGTFTNAVFAVAVNRNEVETKF